MSPERDLIGEPPGARLYRLEPGIYYLDPQQRVTVPMIQVMEGGKVILVDTDGAKPRTWEEQYKRKRDSLLVGQYDIHKTDADKDGKFDNDKVDKEGLWVIDAKGNLTKH